MQGSATIMPQKSTSRHNLYNNQNQNVNNYVGVGHHNSNHNNRGNK
jgi:hypothetical protein